MMSFLVVPDSSQLRSFLVGSYVGTANELDSRGDECMQ